MSSLKTFFKIFELALDLANEAESLDRLNEMLDRGEFDLVPVGRALIANPDWVRVVERGDVSGLVAFEKPMLMTLD